MKDRVPQNPGRMLITPENGIAPYFAKVERADNPVEAGTPMNKATFLKDATASLYGLGQSAVPDDVLVKVKSSLNADASAISNLNTAVSKLSCPLIATFTFDERGISDEYVDLPNAVSAYSKLLFICDNVYTTYSGFDWFHINTSNDKSLIGWGDILTSEPKRFYGDMQNPLGSPFAIATGYGADTYYGGTGALPFITTSKLEGVNNRLTLYAGYSVGTVRIYGSLK